MRSFDGQKLDAVMRGTPALTHILCDIPTWVSNPFNIALEDDRSFGVFEYERPGVYTGHYFFDKNRRGRKAIDLSKKMLSEMFSDYGAMIIRGLTPVDHKAAVWLTLRLGFINQGIVNTIAGPCYIFTLSRDDFQKDAE